MNAITRHWDIVKAALDHEKDVVRPLNNVYEKEYLPAALEIVEQPVSPTARVVARVLLIGLVVTILWMVFGKINIVASAPGRLIPAENVKLVQPAEAGVVRAILVRDGQRVRRGQPLVELDPTVSTAEATQARDALAKAELDAARLRAVVSALDGRGLAFVAPAGTAPEIANTQRMLAQAQVADIRATASAYAANRAGAIASRGEATIQAAKLTETLPLLDEQIEANEKLLEKGYVSKLKVIEMRRQRLSAERDRQISLETAKRADSQISASTSSAAQRLAQSRTEIFTQLAQAEAEARLRREELIKASQRSSLQRLLSPVDGSIAQLAIHTIGGVVEPAKPIMVVVPEGGPLVVEVKVLNKDAGFVRIGQEVAVKLEAFNFTRYGAIPGKIIAMGTDAVEDEKLGLIYTARVAITQTRVATENGSVPITPGMAATADIKTGRRSILSFLLSPIDEARQEAARER